MRKINAYVGECLPENVGVIIDDYPNQDDNSELAINLDLGDCLLNFLEKLKKMDQSNMLSLTSIKTARN